MDVKEDISHYVKPTVSDGLSRSSTFVQEMVENGFKCSSKFKLQEVHSSGMKRSTNEQDQLVNVCDNKSLLNNSLPVLKTEVFSQELMDLEKAQNQAVQKIKSIYEDIFRSTPSEKSDYSMKYFVSNKEVQTENECESSEAPFFIEFQTGTNTVSTNDKHSNSKFLNNRSLEDNFALNEYDISSFNFPLEWYKALESNECEKKESLHMQTTCQSAYEQQTAHYLNFQNFPVSRFSMFKHQQHSGRPCHHHFNYQKWHHNNNEKTNISKLSNLDKRIQMYRTETCNVQELRNMPFKVKHKKHNYAYKTTLKPENLWTKKITIPRPFNLTLDEKHRVRTSKLSREKDSNEKEKQEPRKLFHANPVPLHTYLPLYEKMVEKNKNRLEKRKIYNAEKLKAVVKPLNFLQQHKSRSICKSAPDLLETNSEFRANPPPLHILGEKIDLKMKAEEELRKIRIKLRAEEMIKNSTLPFSTKKFQFTRKRIEDTKTAVRREKIKMREKKRREHQLCKEIGWKFRVGDALLSNQEKLFEKIQSHRESGRARLREYYMELEEMRERVKNQPLLVERQTMEAAKNQAKQHYVKILQNAGLDPDFVQKKSDKFVQDMSGEPESTQYSVNSKNQHRGSNTSLSHPSSLSSSNQQEDQEEYSKEDKYETEEEASYTESSNDAS
ncbi:protein FAM161A-like isoform X2 [Limulus polyphemus]|uniref:Protein FAM161A-like isoform X2 n=1 Tax=Limulus polyphemus TaxID=6850 RepID=A0ABM1SAA3_LIMPO|nr:protein FAM161A-like isoform X2 [Limulus polyphemus]